MIFDLDEAGAGPTRESLLAAIKLHHAQKADDRCFEDDDALYAAAGLPPCDRRVGSKDEMLENCRRFIERRCEGGGWKSYAELEAEVVALRRGLLDDGRCTAHPKGERCGLPSGHEGGHKWLRGD